ncbi:MAG: HEAT repeat domain-containing protein [Bryobacteraceae bacterium]
MTDLLNVLPYATSSGRAGDITPTGFAALVANLSAGEARNQELIEELLGNDPDVFYRGALEVLRTQEQSRGLRFLVGLLVSNDLLEPLLCEPSLRVEQAAVAVRMAIQLDHMVELSLARHLAEGVTAGTHPLLAANASRLLDILSRVSDGTRILPSLSRLLHSTDAGLRSKAALIMGRSNHSAVWVQSHMSDADPRLRANAIEGLWGVETEEARDLMLASLRDASNRVVGNALYGLYAMGESASLAETIKLAAHPAAVFRATAAWVMGETGDSRFRNTVAQLLRDPHPMVRSRALWSLARIKAATARAATGQPWRVSSLMLETMAAASAAGPKLTRRLQVSVAAAGSAASLRAIHFMLSEDGQPVLNYHMTVRPSPPPMSVVFLFPRGGEAQEPPWVTSALGCLAGKRPSDLWAYLPWKPAAETANTAPAAQANQEFPFTPNPDALADSFRRMTQRADCADMWQTLWRALRAESNLARGKRHVIVFAAEPVQGVAGPGLVATVGAALGIVQVISSVPNPALEDLCNKARISYTYAAAPEAIIARIEEAYLNLNARYEISYQTLSQEARELKIRIQCPTGWGETSVAIPPPAG